MWDLITHSVNVYPQSGCECKYYKTMVTLWWSVLRMMERILWRLPIRRLMGQFLDIQLFCRGKVLGIIDMCLKHDVDMFRI